MAEDGALTGTLVMELGSRIAAGVCGSLLSQLGATVVVVEPSQTSTAGKWKHRAQFVAGKLSILDDRDLIGDFVARCDAVLLSSDVDDAQLAPPGEAVVCDITAFGSGAPETASEWQIQALSGIVETTGMADGAPVPVALPIIEFMTGVCAAASTVAALRVQRTCGAGQRIGMALYDCAFLAMATFLPKPLAGSPDPICRAGNRHAMIAPWNVYQARDGWVLICVGSDAQWQRLCGLMDTTDLRAAPQFAKTADRVAHVAEIDAVVQAWVAAQTVDASVAVLNEAQIPCGPIVRIDGCPREPNLDYRGMIRRVRDPIGDRDMILPGSPLRLSVSPGRAPSRIPAPGADRDELRKLASARYPRATQSSKMPTAALAGVRILEIGHYTTAPLCARLLASLGAEVIKIEPPEGEATRDWPPVQRGQGYFFTYTNSDKRSLVLDLQRDSDTVALRDLLKTADVLIENLKPGALARRGFSPETLAALNPALITCSISGFGAHSLYAGRPAYDSVVQAMSGLMDVVRSGGVPLKTGISTADLLGAEFGVLAVLAALAHRDRTGRGQYIDLSMQDITAWLTQAVWNDAGISQVSVIACRDGHVLVEAPSAAPDALAREMRHVTKRDAAAQLARRNMPAAPVLTIHEMLAEPRTSARRLWFHATENGETWPLLASPLRLTATPPAVCRPTPPLGRDTESILAGFRKPATSS